MDVSFDRLCLFTFRLCTVFRGSDGIQVAFSSGLYSRSPVNQHSHFFSPIFLGRPVATKPKEELHEVSSLPYETDATPKTLREMRQVFRTVEFMCYAYPDKASSLRRHLRSRPAMKCCAQKYMQALSCQRSPPTFPTVPALSTVEK